MDLNSPLFDRIRIKPTCDDPKSGTRTGAKAGARTGATAGPASAEAACEAPGCTHPGLYRAPKGRKQEGQYWRFCIDHVRAYNAAYNYFDGMNDAAVEAYQKDAIIGHRPTWSMGVNPAAGDGKGGKPKDGKAQPEAERDWAYADPLGILRANGLGGSSRRQAAPEPQRPRHEYTQRILVLGDQNSRHGVPFGPSIRPCPQCAERAAAIAAAPEKTRVSFAIGKRRQDKPWGRCAGSGRDQSASPVTTPTKGSSRKA